MNNRLVIPVRLEEQRQVEEMDVINDLYFRWIGNRLLPQDDFLLVQHMDQLKLMKEREDLYMRQKEWKML